MIKLYQEESGACIGELWADGKRTLLALLKEYRIFIDAPCGGKGSCGGCRVRYEDGAPEPSEKECRVLTEEELRGGIRLACASVPQEDSRVVLFTKKTERMRALASEQRKGEPEGQERLAGSASEQGVGMPEGQKRRVHSASEQRKGEPEGQERRSPCLSWNCPWIRGDPGGSGARS